jgi:23S rRNA pseudouridine1911/1915/1917 synthase
VHRLDKDTSGLTVIAKNDKAHLSLAAQIAEKSAFRIYTALLCGNIREDGGKIEQPVGRSLKDRKKMAVIPDGRYALTYYTVLERVSQYTLTEFRLHTGRTHQIRAHASYIRRPVAGDLVYGGTDVFKLKGQLLHASRLELTHPTTGKRMCFTAPLPDYFVEVLEKLRKKTF